jgi:hypothetical protein
MNCARCLLSNQAKFASQIMIHFSGIRNIAMATTGPNSQLAESPGFINYLTAVYSAVQF